MTKKKIFIPLLFSFVLISYSSFNSLAEEKEDSLDKSATSNNELQKIIDSFSSYAASIKPELREEIIQYRKKIASINQTKQQLYRQLSQEAQAYFAKEQEYRKSLSSVQKSLQANNNAAQQKK